MKRDFRWTLSNPPDQTALKAFAEEINVPESVVKILLRRGITNYNQAKEFFRPQVTYLHDPFLMDGMRQAVDRILLAKERHERVLIFGDYDVDGTNSAAMLYLYLCSIGIEAIVHIPDRIKEGYGISTLGIDRGIAFGATLLISIDCGITAIDQTEYAHSKNIDVIICDHHEPGEQLPNALAVLDPLKPFCKYPFKHLCGCGVGFKLLQGIGRTLNQEDNVFDYVDFVTLATTADIVPLIGENRILTRLGLQKINTNPRPGIRALIESSGTQPSKISTGQIVFILAPRINAVGRMGDATRAVQLLTSQDQSVAEKMSLVLEEENRNRRKIDEDTFLKAQELAENLLQVGTSPAIVLHHEQWHPGVIGIVASRLVEKYYRPTIMMTTVDGVAKGSARSIVGFDIHKALKRVEDKLIQFGGHKYAAGVSVALERVDEFRDAFNIVVNELMEEEIRTPEIKIDTEISLGELNQRFLKILREFAPYGPGNMRPVFLARNVEIVGTPRIVGKNHLRFRVRQNGHILDAIGFTMGTLLDLVQANSKSLDIVFSVDEQEYFQAFTGNTETFPQLKLKDIRKHEPAATGMEPAVKSATADILPAQNSPS